MSETKKNDTKKSSSDAADDGLRLWLHYATRNLADTQVSGAAADILARLDEGAEPGTNTVEVNLPLHEVQEHIGHGQFVGVERVVSTPDEAAKVIAAIPDTKNVTQVGGVDSIGQPLPGKEKVDTEDAVSVQPSSQSTAATVKPTDKK